ncbi:MAG: DUF2333 family protein [Pseudomonadota bacterium]
MLDPIIAFFQGVFAAIGKGIGYVIGAILWPFLAFGRWYNRRSWLVRVPVAIIVLIFIAGYLHLIWITQFWNPPAPDYADKYAPGGDNIAATATLEPGQPTAVANVGAGDAGTPGDAQGAVGGQCAPSQIARVAADLIELNTVDSTWIAQQPLYKAGLFGYAWRYTPHFDNRAAFQLGINQAVRRTAVELVDRLGRVRGTSTVNSNLQQAREAANYREDAWFLTSGLPFIQPTTSSRLREAMGHLRDFNDELVACDANFDARADNLLQFLDRITADIGSTSEILRSRIAEGGFTGFDVRADDRFWFTYGQLFAYHGILSAVRSDFADVFDQRNLEALWVRLSEQTEEAISTTPPMIANASQSSLIKNHLESIGFDLLRVRSNMVEIRDVLDR